jgi:hypothetical protein
MKRNCRGAVEYFRVMTSLLGGPIRQLLAQALDIATLSAEHRAEIQTLMDEADQADVRYRPVLDSTMGQWEFRAHLVDLLQRGKCVVAQYSTG